MDIIEVRVDIINDNYVEPDETFLVTLFVVEGDRIATTEVTSEITIFDDDCK